MKNIVVVIVGILLLVAGYVWFSSSVTPEETPTRLTDVLEPSFDSSDTKAKVVLDPAKQKTIWDAEHATFEIEHRLGAALLDAIQGKKLDELVGRCLPEFKGLIPNKPKMVEHKKEPFREFSLPVDVELVEATADQLMSYLVDLNDSLKDISRRRLRVLKIARDPSDETKWECRFLTTFSGLNESGGQLLVESESRVWVRFNNDRDLEDRPVLLSWEVESHTERISARSLTQEITAESGLADIPIPDNWKLPNAKTAQYRFQVAVEDFDGDHDLDIALTTVEGRRFVLVQEDNLKFVDRTKELGLPELDRESRTLKFLSAWFDYDNDGYPDLLSGSRLFHNDNGTGFSDVTRASGLTFDPETMGATVADYDGDGLLDLYVLYQKPFNGESNNDSRAQWVDESGTGKSNELWKNLGGGKFSKVTNTANAGGYRRHTHAATWFFYDDDHLPDLYMANDFGRNVVLRNRGDGRFKDVTADSEAGGFATSMGVCAGDVDNDGSTDIYVANMYSKMGRRIIEMVSEDDYPDGIYAQIEGSCAGNQLYSRTSRDSTGYIEKGDHVGVNAVGWAWGPAMFDADNDGLLDLYATTGFLSFQRGEPDG